MKTIRIFLTLGFLIAGCMPCQAGFFGFKVFDDSTQKPIILSETEAKSQQLAQFRDELKQAGELERARSEAIKARLADTEKEIRLVADKKTAATSVEYEYFNKQEALLHDIRQSLHALQQSDMRLLHALRKSIEVLETPGQGVLLPESGAAEKSIFRLDDYYALSKQYVSAQDELNGYYAEKKQYTDEQEKVTKKISQLQTELQQKETEHKRFGAKNKADATARLDGELLDLSIKALRIKLEWLRLSLSEMQKAVQLTDLRINITKDKRNILRKELAKGDRKVLVNAADITKAVSDLDEQKRRYTEKISEYSKTAADLADRRMRLQKAFDNLNKKMLAPVKDVKQLTEWLLAPQKADEVLFYRVALANDSMQTIDRELLIVEAKQDLEKARIAEQELQVDALRAWNMTTRRRRVADQAERESLLMSFVERRATVEHDLQALKNREAVVAGFIGAQTRALAQIKQRRNELLKNQKTFVHKHNNNVYQQVMRAITLSQQNVNRQIDLNAQLLKTYSSTTAILEDMKLQIEAVINKLESLGGIWQRSAGAITWEGIKSTVPDLQFFGDDVLFSLSVTSFKDAFAWLAGVAVDPVALLRILFLIAVFAALYFLLWFGLPRIQRWLQARQLQNGPTFVGRSLAALAQFGYQHLFCVVAWSTLFCAVRYELIYDVGPRVKILFYLGSIFCLGYLAYRCLATLLSAWQPWLDKAFVQRFSLVLHIFVYVSIILLFFKEAFLVTMYGHSELPTLIRAAHSLVVRFCLIVLLMNREVLFAVLPDRGVVWASVRAFIAQFYGLCWTLLAVLIVLSDPYVGYWHLVATVLQGVFLSLLLLVALWLLHRFFRRYSSHLFFSSVGEGARERFSFAKTWYVLFLILGIAFLAVLAILIFGRIWGYSISLERLADFFNLELVKIRGEAAGVFTSFTVRSVLLLVAFIFGGFFVTSLFNRFVLSRLFGLLEVDAGVQNTVVRISGYIIFALALSIGLFQVGLGSWVPYGITFIAVGITWAVRDPINDFFAYFILLVERSVKIGDYIRLNEPDSQLGGVVRKITPRSVILRKDNSFYIVVPNSKVINAPFANWNYKQGYIAFEDIYFSVPYNTDPGKVKEVVLSVLANNALILKNPVPVVRINDFSQSGFDFMVRGFMSTSNLLMQWDVRSDIRFSLVSEFKKNGIEFAVPLRNVRTIKTKQFGAASDDDND